MRYDTTSATCPKCLTRFDPQIGPAKQTTAECPKCSREFPIAKTVRATGAPPSHRMYAKLVLTSDGNKEYLPIDEYDLKLFEEVHTRLLALEGAYPLVPIQEGYNTRQVLNFGYKYWHQMFNERQLLALSLLGQAIANLPEESTRNALYCLFSGALEFNNMFASFKGEGTGAVRHMFSHHVLKPERTPLEANLWGTPKSSGAFSTLFHSRLLRALDYRQAPFELRVKMDGGRKQGVKIFGLSRPIGAQIANSYQELLDKGHQVYLSCGSSTSTDIPANTVDLIITDPPFFDNVHYSELADFFYVWQQHFLGGENNSANTTRHEEEVQHKDAETFARNLGSVFTECCRVLKEDGLLVFTYHHSREEGWTAVAEAAFSARLGFVQAHPVKAEMSVATQKAGSKEPIDLDIILVCRKWHHARPRAGRQLDSAIKVAEESIKRFNAQGRKLSRNDVRVILMGQVLVDASTQGTPEAAQGFVQKASQWAPSEVERLYSLQRVDTAQPGTPLFPTS